MTETPGEQVVAWHITAEGELTVHEGDAVYDPADDPKNATEETDQ